MTDLTFNDGRTMPRLGLGTWKLPDGQAAAVVRRALDVGYRLIDTAAIYGNERGVGDGAQGSEAFVTTKLWNNRQGDPAAALDESLALLGLDAVDLYLMHWPVPSAGRYVDAWKAMVDLRDAGKARSIGVSNFLPEHLDAIIEATGVTPVLNQIELHPRYQRREERAYHEAHGIVTQSWSPLGQGGDLLRDPGIVAVAQKHGRSAAQVVIAWHLAHGFSVIPKAADPEHMSDNFAALDLTLGEDDVAAIDALERGERMGEDALAM
ncbi:2,5-diketo-D-gluconate reductase A [Sphingomonas insulae]|uniref:Aldo/keto reductase n=1 Tax=Sphingomonas insulae TaxID=424800 RepID=A0ABP3T6M2_9SPHN|nr:aldo/keto reductase [Sphingomonas insulae]NIJ31223.1 2,5-diketo-D-gluconate reductase A [Sphingomonas insulae]